jgi:hypothetical protein
MRWPVSEVNSLNFAVGTGYSAYVVHPEFSRLYITPGSELSFDLYTGDFWINLHDRFSITENNYQDPTVVGSADYSQLQNALGLSATWDLNKAILRAGYDHVNYVSLQGSPQVGGGQPSGKSEVFSSSTGYLFRPGLQAGLELGGGLINYTQTGINQAFTDASEWNVGSFTDWQASQYIHARVDGGYTLYSPVSNSALGSNPKFSGVYGQAELIHRLNQYVNYTLTGGRSLNFAFYGGTVDLYFLRWQANWNLLRKVTLGTSFSYEHGTQVAVGGETFNRYGPGINLTRLLTGKLTGNLSYQYYWRGSDLPGRDYSVNVVMANMTYKF